jgi:hypothetical protein
MNKFRYFVAFFVDGSRLMLKAPASKVTEKTARKYAQHWAKMQKGIEGANIVRVEGCDIVDGNTGKIY